MAGENSGWIGTTAGLISASVTLAAGFLLEDYKRHRDRQGTAMAFMGEIKTLVDLSIRLDLSGKAKGLADQLRPLQQLPPGFGTPELIKIGNPVFDKAADKIGLLPDDIPMLISEFYNWISGLRIGYFSALARPANVQSRVSQLDFVAGSWPDLEALAKDKLIPKLLKVSSEQWSLTGRIKASSARFERDLRAGALKRSTPRPIFCPHDGSVGVAVTTLAQIVQTRFYGPPERNASRSVRRLL